MSDLAGKIDQDIKEAMKSKDSLTLSVLRMVKAACTNLEIEKKKDLSDDDVVSVLQKQFKQRRESFDSFKEAGRDELAQKEETEMKVLEKYLPEQMSEAELKGIVEAAVAESGAQTKADIGKVMKVLMPKVKGKADGKLVNKLVGECLNG